jgi:hypothetical protein
VTVAVELITKFGPDAPTPATFTAISPVVAPGGTSATICESPHPVTAATTPLKVTALLLCVAPKFEPLMVTDEPTGPTPGDTVATEGGLLTVNWTPLLATPLTVTVTGPVVALDGTVVVMLVSLQLLTEASTPLNRTWPLP